MIIDPSTLAEKFREEIRASIASLKNPTVLVGLLASEDDSSHTYSQYMKVGCDKVGVIYREIVVPKDKISESLNGYNSDPETTGVIVYYPIFGGDKDRELRGKLSPYKDVEGLHQFWLEKLYSNERTFNHNGTDVKALLPCTPLAILKLLEYSGLFSAIGKPLAGKTVTVFNRSEVVGRPLAYMLANDGAKVYSFDINDVMEFQADSQEKLVSISRKDALSESDIIITGVPNSKFEKITASEVRETSCCLNFSSLENFEPNVKEKVETFIPRVGPVTVTMCLRNAIRMAESFKI